MQGRLLTWLRTRAADPIVRFPFLVVVYLVAIGLAAAPEIAISEC